MNDTSAWNKAWSDVQSLRPIIEVHKQEAEDLRRLPDAVARAFLERDVYRLMLPEQLGGAGIAPLQHFDLIVEVSRADASAGWLYWLAGGALIVAGRAPPEVTSIVFATGDCGQAAALAPTGRAVATAGGYRRQRPLGLGQRNRPCALCRRQLPRLRWRRSAVGSAWRPDRADGDRSEGGCTVARYVAHRRHARHRQHGIRTGRPLRFGRMGVPSRFMARIWKPPPGNTTTAAPVFFPLGA